MSEILKILAMVRHHLYNSVTNPKVWAAGILILAAIYKSIYPFARIAGYYNKPVSFAAAAIPFLASYSILFISCAMLLIFSEMPFQNQQQIFLLTRSGKRSWYISQLLYIIAVSLSVAIFVILISWLIICNHISFANSWGSIENTLCQSNELILKYQSIGWFSYDIINSFSPRQAFAWCVLVGTLIYTVFGVVIFALNMTTRKIGGIIFGAVIIGYHALMWNFYHPKFKWAAILDWSNIGYIDLKHNTTYPTPEFVFGVLGVGAAIAVVIVAINARKRSDIL